MILTIEKSISRPSIVLNNKPTVILEQNNIMNKIIETLDNTNYQLVRVERKILNIIKINICVKKINNFI